MTDASIGPIKFSVPHLQDTNNQFVLNKEIKQTGNLLETGKVTESEEFSVVLENSLAKQLIGLCKWDEIFWLDTSTDLEDGNDFKHKGWYLISADSLELVGPDYAQLSLTGRCISRAEQEYFQQDYLLINQLPYDFAVPLAPTVQESYYYTYYDSADGKIKMDTALKSVAKLPTAASIDTSVGNVSWSWKESLYSSGTAQAKNTSSGTCYQTNRLVGSSYGFSIPTISEITGLVLSIRYANNTPSNSGCSKVHAVTIDGNAGYYSVNSVSYVTGTNTNSMQTWTLGSSSNRLGLSSSPSTYNAGINVKYWATVAPGYTSFVDYYNVTLYYRYKTGTYTRIQPASSAKTAWGSLAFAASLPTGCSIKWDVYRASDNTKLLSGITASGTSLASLPHVDLKFVANFTAYNGTTPTLSNVSVSES